ncbi:MAG: A24 family peptidase [Terriglobales bacterium]
MSLSLQILPLLLSSIAGYTDWRSRRIPNWLTIPGLLVGVLLNTLVRGWPGTKDSLLGAGLGLALLLPFVIIRALGAGDWKLVGALGAFLGPRPLMLVLVVTILVNGVMAFVMIVWKKRVRQTARNFAQMLAAVASFRLPGRELTLDNPDAVKVPFGVAVAIAMILYTVSRIWVRG